MKKRILVGALGVSCVTLYCGITSLRGNATFSAADIMMGTATVCVCGTPASHETKELTTGGRAYQLDASDPPQSHTFNRGEKRVFLPDPPFGPKI